MDLLDHSFIKPVFEDDRFSMFLFDGTFKKKTTLTFHNEKVGVFICQKGNFISSTTRSSCHLHEDLVSFSLFHECEKTFAPNIDIRFLLILFSRATLETFIKSVNQDVQLILGKFSNCACTVQNSSQQISVCAGKIFLEANGKYWGYKIALNALFQDLLVHFVRLFSDSSLAKGARDPVVQKAELYIHARFFHEMTLEEIAAWAGVSKNFLCRIFKQATGHRLFQYINHVRIQRACDMLKERGVTVEKVAGKVGFHNLNYFHKVFKAVTGKTPSEFRAEGTGPTLKFPSIPMIESNQK